MGWLYRWRSKITFVWVTVGGVLLAFLERLVGLPGDIEDIKAWQEWTTGRGWFGMDLSAYVPVVGWLVVAGGLAGLTADWWWKRTPLWKRGAAGKLFYLVRRRPDNPTSIRQCRNALRYWQFRPRDLDRDDHTIGLVQELGTLSRLLAELKIGTPSTTEKGFNAKKWEHYLVSLEILALQGKVDEARQLVKESCHG